MPRKPSPPRDNPAQSKRFIETARKIGADESPEAFERVFVKLAKGARTKPDQSKSGARRKRP